jgi:hypothetical protein
LGVLTLSASLPASTQEGEPQQGAVQYDPGVGEKHNMRRKRLQRQGAVGTGALDGTARVPGSGGAGTLRWDGGTGPTKVGASSLPTRTDRVLL